MDGDELPEGWETVKLKDVASSLKGKKPQILSDEYFENSVPYLDIKAIEKKEIRQYADVKSSAIATPQDVLIVWDGARCGWVGTGVAGAAGSTIAIIRPKNINSQYLFYFLKTHFKQLNHDVKGIGIPHLKPELLWGLPVPFPPLSEQTRIAARLDELNARIAAARQKIQRLQATLAHARRSVLNAAVTGELTREWREYQPLEEINLDKLKELKINSNFKQSKISEIFDYEEKGNHFEIPENWFFCCLDKICNSFDYGTSQKSENSGNVPVLRMGNIQNGKIVLDDLKYTSDPEEINKYRLQKGDVLFNRTNSPELVGKTALFNEDVEAIFAGYLIRMNNFTAILPAFVNIVLNTEYAKLWCWATKTDGVSQSNINASKLSKFEIPLPPLSEQVEIVRRVEALTAGLSAAESRAARIAAALDALPQALLRQAFSGKL